MLRPLPLLAAVVTVAVSPLVAQVGNEVVFVGTSVGGSTDSHYFVESGTGAIDSQGGNTFTDNVTDAVWADTGRNLYVAQSIQPQVSLAQWNGATPTWSTFWPAPGACYGLGHDAFRRRLWVLTGPTASSRELVCLDADPLSPGYGSVVTQTTTLTGQSRERWELSPTGNLAAVPTAFLQGGLFEIVDTDPSSPTFLQIVVSVTVPNATGFTIATDCALSIDDQYAYLLYTGLGIDALAVLHVPTQTWLDFSAAPGQQDFTLPLTIGNRMDLSLASQFAVISGQGSGGWAGRVDFDYLTPTNTTFTQYVVPNGLPNCNGASMSPDGTRVAVTATPVNLATPSYLAILDAFTGATLQYVTLSAAWNVYTTAWQDASPDAVYTTFGAGCGGTLGTLQLAASPGSTPALGASFDVTVDNIPTNVVLVSLGFSASMSGPVPLPLDLTFFGMPGCSLLVELERTAFLVTAGTQATITYDIPADPYFFGVAFFNQAFAYDPPATPAGWTASNAGVGVIGF